MYDHPLTFVTSLCFSDWHELEIQCNGLLKKFVQFGIRVYDRDRVFVCIKERKEQLSPLRVGW